MNILRIVIVSLFSLLLLLLLLLNIKSCNKSSGEESSPEQDVVSGPGSQRDDTSSGERRAARGTEDTSDDESLKISLLWNFEGDIDLAVKQPNGHVINRWNKKDSISGGRFDGDDNRLGGTDSKESIFWEHPREGKYVVILTYYSQSLVTQKAESGFCGIVVERGGHEPQVYNVMMSRVKEVKDVIEIEI